VKVSIAADAKLANLLYPNQTIKAFMRKAAPVNPRKIVNCISIAGAYIGGL
jgi:hypothetical protein